MEGRFYWLKLKRDFFKRHDIMIIESMPNGKDYILFYLKLLCESVDHEGRLRFSENIPYNENMLSTITNTNVDIVRSAVKVFAELGMMDILDDGTYFMNQVEGMIGSAVDNDNANRQRKLREKRLREKRQAELLPVTKSNADVTPDVTKNNESKSKEKEIDTDIDNKRLSSKRFTPPSLAEVAEYCQARKNKVDPERFIDFYTSKGWIIGKNSPMKDWKAAVRTWEKNDFQSGSTTSPKKNSFHNFQQHDYDFAEIEKRLFEQDQREWQEMKKN